MFVSHILYMVSVIININSRVIEQQVDVPKQFNHHHFFFSALINSNHILNKQQCSGWS